MRNGRPRATSRDTIAEAACELFLEQGYEGTTVADITRRAGVSRSSFFNYFGAKADVLWYGLDERIAALERRTPEEDPFLVVDELLDGFAPGTLALAIANADVMGVARELDVDAAIRLARLARAVARGVPGDRLDAAGVGGAVASIVLAAVNEWSTAGAGTRPLVDVARPALAVVRRRG